MRSPSSSSFLLGWLFSFCSSGRGVEIAIHASGADQTDDPRSLFRRPSNALRDAHILSSLVGRMGLAVFAVIYSKLSAGRSLSGRNPRALDAGQRNSSEITARSGRAGKWLT